MGIFSKRRRRKKNDSVLGKLSIFRWLGPGATTATLVAVGYMALTGKWDFSILDSFRTPPDVVRFDPVPLGDPGKSPDVIRVATFNIRMFGEKKSASATVMPHLAKIVYQFDVVAIQEVRAADGMGTPIQRLIDLINQSGGKYAATLSDPIGSKEYNECYAFVWDETRVRLAPDTAYVVFDNDQRIEREPMVASFEAVLPPGDPRKPFRFTAINAHTKPDAVHPDSPDGEINVLDDVYIRVGQYEFEKAREDDFILLGDLNVSHEDLGQLSTIPNLISVAGHLPTNTAGNATYDHILVDEWSTNEYTRKSGVMDLKLELNLTQDQAEEISDHLPVWAEFSRYEAPHPSVQNPSIQTANRSPQILR